MYASQLSSQFACELTIIQAKNVESVTSGKLFVRYYPATGNDQKILLNTREISAKSKIFWNQSFMLECHGSQEDNIRSLRQQFIVIELRRRITNAILGNFAPSQLLGRAEVSWKTVCESPKMETEMWVPLVSGWRCVHKDVKAPAIKVGIKLKIPFTVGTEKEKTQQKGKVRNECGCNDIGCTCSGYEIFAIASSLDGLYMENHELEY